MFVLLSISISIYFEFTSLYNIFIIKTLLTVTCVAFVCMFDNDHECGAITRFPRYRGTEQTQFKEKMFKRFKGVFWNHPSK